MTSPEKLFQDVAVQMISGASMWSLFDGQRVQDSMWSLFDRQRVQDSLLVALKILII